MRVPVVFFFNDTATTEIYTLSLHDALPILAAPAAQAVHVAGPPAVRAHAGGLLDCFDDVAAVADVAFPFLLDRKSTRLNSSHQIIPYAVFCLKKTTILIPADCGLPSRRQRH